jgi:hypothetical protein
MAGDTLARGGKSATFGPPAKVTAERWLEIWKAYPEKAVVTIKEESKK